jgi:hypothetical protein
MRTLIEFIPAFSLAGLAALKQSWTAADISPERIARPERAFQVPKARIPLAAQWQRLSLILSDACAAALRASEAHAAARTHIEVAEFTYDLMIEELAAITPKVRAA